MSEIKYEPVFGDQSLFDGAPEDAEAVYKSSGVNSRPAYFKFSSGKFEHYICSWSPVPQAKDVESQNLSAMRRIVRTPVWTKADQQAGKLPEVGCQIAGKRTGINTVLFNNGDYIVVVSDSHSIGKYTAYEVQKYFYPPETPEERQQREEDEFYSEVKDEWFNETSVKSESFELGVRAAYRKLKMPEVQK